MNSRLQQIQNWPERAAQAGCCAATLAKNCGVSLRTLERHFLKEFGQSPKAWLMAQRHQKAAGLLTKGLGVKETAASLEYRHPNHLTNGFKKQYGYCPTDMPPPPQPSA